MIWAKLNGTVDNLKYFLLQFKSFSSRNSNLQTYALYWISNFCYHSYTLATYPHGGQQDFEVNWCNEPVLLT